MSEAVLGGGESTSSEDTSGNAEQSTETNPGVEPNINSPEGEADSDSTSSSLDFIPEQFREAAWAQKYKTPEDFFNGIDNMNKMLGKKEIVEGIKVPGEDATEEDWANFHKELGVPEKADAYDLKVDIENPLFDTEPAAQGFRELAHKNGLTPKQAQGLFNDYVEMTNGRMAELQEQNQKTTDQVLKELWGDDKDAGFAAAKRGAAHLGIGDELDSAGISTNPLVLKMARALGETIKEGTVKDGGESSGKSKEDILKEARELQMSPAYQSDPATVEKVAAMYKQVYGS